jgi:hypothetical protein
VVALWIYINFICFLGKLGFSTSTVSDDIHPKVKCDPDQNAYENLHHPLNLTTVILKWYMTYNNAQSDSNLRCVQREPAGGGEHDQVTVTDN